MKIVFALLFLTCCIAVSNATLKLLKSKLKSAPLIYPVRYQTIKYLASPVTIAEPLPATYVRPVSKHSAHFSTYSVTAPSVVTYSVPVQAYAAPVAYTQPLSVTYDASPVLYYTQSQTVYAEQSPAHVVEEHLTYDEHYKR